MKSLKKSVTFVDKDGKSETYDIYKNDITGEEIIKERVKDAATLLVRFSSYFFVFVFLILAYVISGVISIVLPGFEINCAETMNAYYDYDYNQYYISLDVTVANKMKATKIDSIDFKGFEIYNLDKELIYSYSEDRDSSIKCPVGPRDTYVGVINFYLTDTDLQWLGIHNGDIIGQLRAKFKHVNVNIKRPKLGLISEVKRSKENNNKVDGYQKVNHIDTMVVTIWVCIIVLIVLGFWFMHKGVPQGAFAELMLFIALVSFGGNPIASLEDPHSRCFFIFFCSLFIFMTYLTIRDLKGDN